MEQKSRLMFRSGVARSVLYLPFESHHLSLLQFQSNDFISFPFTEFVEGIGILDRNREQDRVVPSSDTREAINSSALLVLRKSPNLNPISNTQRIEIRIVMPPNMIPLSFVNQHRTRAQIVILRALNFVPDDIPDFCS